MPSIENRSSNGQEMAAHTLAEHLRAVSAQQVVWRATGGAPSLNVIWVASGDTYEAYLPETNTLPQAITNRLCRVTQEQKVIPLQGVYHEDYDGGAYWHVSANNREIVRLRNISNPFATPLSATPDYSVLPWSRKLSKSVSSEKINKKPKVHKIINVLSAIVLTSCAVVAPATILKDSDSQISPIPLPAASSTMPQIGQPSPSEANTPSPAPQKNVKTLHLNIATWNALYSNDPKKVGANLKVLFETNENSVVALQEAKRLTKSVLAEMACSYTETSCNKQYAMFPGNKGDNGRNQIVWNKDKLTFLDGETKHASSDPGHTRIINWVHLKDTQLGEDLYLVDAHAPHKVDAGGSPSKDKAQVHAYKKYMHDLVSTIKYLQERGKPVFLDGDLNVDFRADNAKCKTVFFPCRQIDPIMNNVWSYANISGANGSLSTNGNNKRIIDRSYFSETNATEITVTKAYVGTDNGNMGGGDSGSDHKPFNVQYQLEISGTSPTFPLTLQSIANFRDGAASANGAIAKHSIYRSSELRAASQSDVARLSSLLSDGAIIDLRSKEEKDKNPDPAIPGVAYYSFPVTPATKPVGYVNNFVVNEADRVQFGAALTQIANTNGDVLLHCAKGKDRTGWLYATLQSIQGVDDATILREYLESKTAGGNVDASWLNAALTAARKQYGSMTGYASQGLGLSDATIAKLKAKLTPQ